MTSYKLNQPGILALEKAMWMARISSVIGEEPVSTADIVLLLINQSMLRGVRCISETTITRYLREMRDREMLVSDKRVAPNSPKVRFYWKVKKIGSD